jgi:hypothetical protein
VRYFRELLDKRIESLAEDCVRKEVLLAEHDAALAGTVLDVLDIDCPQCRLREPDRTTVERVILLPMWVKTNAFVDALETYRNHLVGVAWHRGSLELETGWLRRLCRMTGQNLKLEQWRTLLRLGGGGEVECEMEGPE